jgi:hypothetical protein
MTEGVQSKSNKPSRLIINISRHIGFTSSDILALSLYIDIKRFIVINTITTQIEQSAMC